MIRRNIFRALAASLTWLFFHGHAEAARFTVHYQPAETSEGPLLQPAGGLVTPSGKCLQPTCIMTFKHGCTGRPVSVPLALPEGTPIIEHRWRKVVYNYGSYTVEVMFLPDGSVDDFYNSGLLRGI